MKNFIWLWFVTLTPWIAAIAVLLFLAAPFFTQRSFGAVPTPYDFVPVGPVERPTVEPNEVFIPWKYEAVDDVGETVHTIISTSIDLEDPEDPFLWLDSIMEIPVIGNLLNLHASGTVFAEGATNAYDYRNKVSIDMEETMTALGVDDTGSCTIPPEIYMPSVLIKTCMVSAIKYLGAFESMSYVEGSCDSIYTTIILVHEKGEAEFVSEGDIGEGSCDALPEPVPIDEETAVEAVANIAEVIKKESQECTAVTSSSNGEYVYINCPTDEQVGTILKGGSSFTLPPGIVPENPTPGEPDAEPGEGPPVLGGGGGSGSGEFEDLNDVSLFCDENPTAFMCVNSDDNPLAGGPIGALDETDTTDLSIDIEVDLAENISNVEISAPAATCEPLPSIELPGFLGGGDFDFDVTMMCTFLDTFIAPFLLMLAYCSIGYMIIRA